MVQDPEKSGDIIALFLRHFAPFPALFFEAALIINHLHRKLHHAC